MILSYRLEKEERKSRRKCDLLAREKGLKRQVLGICDILFI